jgi:hypothetical protein
MSDKPEYTPQEEGERIGHLMVFILAGTKILRHDVLDVVDIDREEIVHIADNIEKYTMELAHLVLGYDLSEWQAEQERKRDRA